MIKDWKWMEPCPSVVLALNKASEHSFPKGVIFQSLCDKPIF